MTEARGVAFSSLPSSFGCLASVTGVDAIVANRGAVLSRFHQSGGLLVIRGLGDISATPEDLITISRLFGPEVENIRETLTSPRFFHSEEPEIMVLSNLPPCDLEPPPAFEGDVDDPLPVRFPKRPNWHTDQSYRRPPPDVSLLYGLQVTHAAQGQTLYADMAGAYDALDADTKQQIEHLDSIHVASWCGRTPADIRAGRDPLPLLAHQKPQRHPIVRTHPVTGRKCLYICEEKQMDFVDGPVVGLSTGPDSAGAQLIRRLLNHATDPQFVYVHEWQPHDLAIGDNRSLLHAASWYDAKQHDRTMWRTTVMGNPGPYYAGEAKSWIPLDGSAVMDGLEDAAATERRRPAPD